MVKKQYKKTEINLLKKKKKKPSFSLASKDFFISLLHKERVLFAALVSAIVLLGLVIVSGMRLTAALQSYKQAKVEKDKVVYELSFWEQVLRIHPDYRDAYFKVAVLKYRLGDTTSSRGYLQKAMEIDPNFEEGKELQELLKSN